jgi:hypothetical protein
MTNRMLCVNTAAACAVLTAIVLCTVSAVSAVRAINPYQGVADCQANEINRWHETLIVAIVKTQTVYTFQGHNCTLSARVLGRNPVGTWENIAWSPNLARCDYDTRDDTCNGYPDSIIGIFTVLGLVVFGWLMWVIGDCWVKKRSHMSQQLT